LKNKFLD